MKTLIFALSLSFSLFVSPAFAQLGPAGVPGLFGLVDEVLPNTPDKPAQQKHAAPEHAAQDCPTTRGTQQCGRGATPSPEALKVCKGKRGAALSQCLKHQEKIEECSRASEPARCVRFLTAHELCGKKLGAEHRQCLYNILIPKK